MGFTGPLALGSNGAGGGCPSPQLIVTENVPGVRASLNEATAPVNEVLTTGAIGMSEGVIAGVTTVEGVLVEDVLVSTDPG